MFTRKLYTAIIFIVFSLYSLSGNDFGVNDSTISAVGFISDKSGAIASGFFINENTFVTNYHVTSGLDIESANIEMKDGSSFSVKIIKKEYSTIDLAIIQTNEVSQNILKLEDEIKPEKNDEVYSIGNPTDTRQHVDYFKVTKGRIKKIIEDEWHYDNRAKDEHKALVIQHSAIIKPGNSGGPLLNNKGRVIGINTFFYNDSLNYAVHVNELINILKKNGIKYNEAVYKSDSKNKKENVTLMKRFEFVFDKQIYYLRTFRFLIISVLLLYYMFVIFGTLTILTYVIIKGNKKRTR